MMKHLAKILCTAVTALLLPLFSHARELKAEAFEELTTDISARTNPRTDLNGDVCALIKVSLPVAGAKFEGMVVDSEFDVNEYKVYMADGANKITIKCPGFETLQVDFPSLSSIKGVKSKVTYRLKLSGYETASNSGRYNPNNTKLAEPTNQMYKNYASGNVAGHGFVDLGLPSGVKWATTNVGANEPADYGEYYAWGETYPKSYYSESNSATYHNGSLDVIAGNRSHDAAHSTWGDSWQLPTEKDFSELIRHCNIVWAQLEGVGGFRVTGPNGNSIFLPASGQKGSNGAPQYQNEVAWYWTGDQRSARDNEAATARVLYVWRKRTNLNTVNASVTSKDRYNGYAIRPVIH